LHTRIGFGREVPVDAVLFAIVSRAFERILVVAAGGLAIYLGYRLFVNMPEHEKSSGKVILPGGISIFLSRVGPGIFFSLFGAVVIALSFHYGIKYDEETASTATTEVAGTPVTIRRSMSGIAPAIGPDDPNAILRERTGALLAVASLNKAAAALRPDLPTHEHNQILAGVHDAKLRLMESVWDAEHWGAFEAFAIWTRDHPTGSPPSELAEAVSYFRAGSDLAGE
jgi:hypothetical protein